MHSEMDLEFALGWSNQSVRTQLNNNSGVGVNAASRVNMSFVASEPLLEVVWCPDKGLSLKCVDYSLTNKNSSLLWDVGPSNMVLSPWDGVRLSGTNADRPINESKLTSSPAEFEGDCEAANDGNLPKPPRSSGSPVFGSRHGPHTGIDGNIEEANTAHGVSVVHYSQEQEYPKVNEEESLCSPKNIQLGNMAETSETIADQENQRMTNESNLPSPVIGHSELALDITESKNKMETHGSIIALLPEKLESTSKNNVQRERHQLKGKEKALSDRETNEKTSKDDDDDNHESMESCSSANLFSEGTKRWRFEQPLIVGSKRIKKQVRESPALASLGIYDSSFMNWISSMAKGLPKPNQDEGPTLALTLDRPNHGHDYDEKIMTCNKTHESGSRNTRFQTVFQSMYSQNTLVHETRILNDSYSLTGSKEPPDEKTCRDIIICNTKKPQMGTGRSLDPIWHGKVVSEKRLLCSEEIQKPIDLISGKGELKQNLVVPLCRKQILDAPKGMFDAISRLRLSRIDILRWKNSHIPLSNLDGFFLRLRLGKSEGPGGTGYYVACINGMQRENSPRNSKNPISVSIRGINCLVESQYVSNHDFLEDELMAWWKITSKSGKIPTEPDLKSKFEERKKLGF